MTIKQFAVLSTLLAIGAGQTFAADTSASASKTNELLRGYSNTNASSQAGQRIYDPAGADRAGQPVAGERVTRAKDLIGMEVKNAQGESLGKVEDIALNFQSGRIADVAMSSGGFLGIRDRLYAIPFTSFSRSPADEKVLVLNL